MATSKSDEQGLVVRPASFVAGILPLRVNGSHVRAERDDLSAIYDAHATALYRYLATLLGNAEEAEDALQEVFLNLARRPRRDHIRDLRPYLFRAAHNQAIMAMRRRKRSEEMAAISWIDLETCETGDRELVIDIDLAVRQLPPAQREVIALKLGEDLTFREIAQALGIPRNTAASRYRLALARLRVLLEGGEPNE